MKFQPVCPLFTEQHISKFYHHNKTPPTWFQIDSFTLRLVVYNTAGQNTCSLFGNCQRSIMQQAARVLALSTTSTIIITAAQFWLADGHHVVQTVIEITVFPVMCGPLMYSNLISVISPSLQNFRLCHIQSLNIDGK